MSAVTVMPHPRITDMACDPTCLRDPHEHSVDIVAGTRTPSVQGFRTPPKTSFERRLPVPNDAQPSLADDSGDDTNALAKISPKPFKVQSGTNTVYCIKGRRDIFIKHTDATEIAAWAGLLGRRSKRLVSAVAIHDRGNKLSMQTKSKRLLRVLTERQREAVDKALQSDLCIVITAGPRIGWRRRTLHEFTKDVRDPMVQQRVLEGCFLAIDEIHAHGVQHNDLHSGNFFVDTWDGQGVRPRRDIEVRLYDFDRSTRIVQADDGHVYHSSSVPEITPVWCPNSDTWHFLHTVFRLASFCEPVRALLAKRIGKPEYVKRRGPVLGVEDPARLEGAWSHIDGTARTQGTLGSRPSQWHVVFEFAQAPATGFGHNPCFFEPKTPYDHLGLPVLQSCVARKSDRVGSIPAFQFLPSALAFRRLLRRNVDEVIAVLRLCLFRSRIPLDLHSIVVWFMNAVDVDS